MNPAALPAEPAPQDPTLHDSALYFNRELSQLDSWAMKTAFKIQELSPAMRQTVDGLLDALSKR